MSRRRTVQTPAASAQVDHYDQQLPRKRPPVRHDAEEGLVSTLVAEAAALEDSISQWWQELVVRPLEALSLVWNDDDDDDNTSSEHHHQQLQHPHAVVSGQTAYNSSQHNMPTNPLNRPSNSTSSTYPSSNASSSDGSSNSPKTTSDVHAALDNPTTNSSSSPNSSSSDRLNQGGAVACMEQLLPLEGMLDAEGSFGWYAEDPKKCQ